MSAGNRGFINFGATCYLNSALQCLSHIDILNDDNFREQVKKYKKNDTPLLDEWFDLQDKMWSDDHGSAIHTMDFIKVFMNKCREKSIEFNSFVQNDTSEFLIYFMDFIHEEISRKISFNITGEPETIISKLYHNNLKQFKKEYENNYSCIIENFYSRTLSITGCTECGYKTDNHEPVQIISLTLHPKYNSLMDCLDEYVKTFRLDNENKWTCDKCNISVNPEKKTIFWEFSPVIIFLIKKYNENGVIENQIDYPLKLNLDKYKLNYKKSSTEYKLQGTCIHLGGLNGGHYYSICKNNNDNRWRIYNDSQVSDVKESEVFNNHPYCLFYKRV
tara:strand:- start:892 stop:1887 length:996 start_codon:yes stop_codon:yes gene_type:complete